MLLDIVNNRADTLGSSNAILKVESKSLNSRSVRHPFSESSRVGAGHLEDGRIVLRGRNILANGPAATGLQELLAQHEAVQKLSSLRVRGILQNGTGLRPRDEATLDGEGDVVRSYRAEAAGSGERGSPLGIVAGEECSWGPGATNPARVQGKKLIKPLSAELLNANIDV